MKTRLYPAVRQTLTVYVVLMLTWGLLATVPARSQTVGNRRATVRVGMWTLWHDRNLTLSPAASREISIKICSPCTMHGVKEEVSLHAAGSNLELVIQGRTIHAPGSSRWRSAIDSSQRASGSELAGDILCEGRRPVIAVDLPSRALRRARSCE